MQAKPATFWRIQQTYHCVYVCVWKKKKDSERERESEREKMFTTE